MDLNGKVAVVTGAGSGTGRAIAKRLGAEGTAVVVADIDPEMGHETVRRIETVGGRSIYAQTDVRVDRDCEAMVAIAERTYGGLGVLVNCAGS